MEKRVLESSNGVLHVCCREEGDFSQHKDDEVEVLESWKNLGFTKTRIFNDVDSRAMKRRIEARSSRINQKTKRSDSAVEGGLSAEPLKRPGSVVLTETSYEFELGDMVWGKVKSYPWWPGQIFDEALTSSSVQRKRHQGYVLVAFYGDNSYRWFDPAELIPFEPFYPEKSQQKESFYFVNAVKEATNDARRRSALGLACCCLNPVNFRPTSVPGYCSVDVQGYEPGGIFSTKQIAKARDSFRAEKMLSFIKRWASAPFSSENGSIQWIMDIATVTAYRTAVFEQCESCDEQFDDPYSHAFGLAKSPLQGASGGQPSGSQIGIIGAQVDAIGAQSEDAAGIPLKRAKLTKLMVKKQQSSHRFPTQESMNNTALPHHTEGGSGFRQLPTKGVSQGRVMRSSTVGTEKRI